ncbi:MAG: hypothetical protein KAX99_00320 [Azonexus sp.]|nr:hypothetical protein [Azonexus sp.]
MIRIDWRGRTLNILSWVILIAVLVPEWWVFFKSEAFVFVNGWDEETYLSWQGVLGAKDSPGYYSLYLYWVLHQIGFSGAVQNLISDTIFFPLTLYLVFLSLKRINFGADRALAYAMLICLSSVLFNYANPLVSYLLGPYDGSAIFMAGHEYYPTILRTPNPQVSYFLLALAVYGFLRLRQAWILLVPLPFLYFHVAVPYVFLLGLVAAQWIVVTKFRSTSSPGRTVLVSLTIFLTFSLGLTLLFLLGGLYRPDNVIRQSSHLLFETRRPQIPLVLMLLWFFGALIIFFKWARPSKFQGAALGWLAMAALASVNVHIVAGFMFSQKNYYDYGVSVLLSLGLVVMIEMLANEKVRYWVVLVTLLLVGYTTFQSQHRYAKYAVSMSARIAPILEEVRKDPLHSIIPSLDVSSMVAYSTPKLLAPPFSYLYYFGFIARQCSEFELLLDNAVAYAESELQNQPEQLKELMKTASNIERGRQEAGTMPYLERDYCHANFDHKKNFTLFQSK